MCDHFIDYLIIIIDALTRTYFIKSAYLIDGVFYSH